MTFMDLIGLLAAHAVMALGGFKGQNNEKMPPNPEAAKYSIDLLTVLQERTEGRRSEAESKALLGALFDVRQDYVALLNEGQAGRETNGKHKPEVCKPEAELPDDEVEEVLIG